MTARGGIDSASPARSRDGGGLRTRVHLEIDRMRRAISDDEKKRRGTYRPSRSKPLLPAMPLCSPEQPQWLPEPAKRVWEGVVDQLTGRLAAVDQAILTLYCVQAAKLYGNPRTFSATDYRALRLLRRDLWG
jgi:hypothetical protein